MKIAKTFSSALGVFTSTFALLALSTSSSFASTLSFDSNAFSKSNLVLSTIQSDEEEDLKRLFLSVPTFKERLEDISERLEEINERFEDMEDIEDSYPRYRFSNDYREWKENLRIWQNDFRTLKLDLKRLENIFRNYQSGNDHSFDQNQVTFETVDHI